jgi:hypothetical protein
MACQYHVLERLDRRHIKQSEVSSGHVSYAVFGFGGILGIGDDHYPLRWPNQTPPQENRQQSRDQKHRWFPARAVRMVASVSGVGFWTRPALG